MSIKKLSLKNSKSTSSVNQNHQNNSASFQFKDNRPENAAQRKIQEVANESTTIIQPKANNTGLPNQLKSGIENLSGFSMDDVKVHYNSPKPAQLQAHAYAQGTDIHIASGQEKHLPHEAWHVVQQKQGRVRPTMQMKGNVNINDDAGLEKEADVMGERALQMRTKANKNQGVTNSVTLEKSNGKQGVGFVDNRSKATFHSKFLENSLPKNVSKSSIQLMAQGNQQAAVQERRLALGQIRAPNLINAPAPADVVAVTAALNALRTQIEQAVAANVLVAQPHGGNMAELRARFHNDYVHITYRGGLDQGHAQRTRALLVNRIAHRALEATRQRARNQRAAVQAQIVQL